MKLRLLAVAFVMVCVLGVTSCTPNRSGDGQIRTMLMTDNTGIDDRSFNAAAWRGILEFYGETWENTPSRGTLFNVLTAPTMDFYIPNLQIAVEEGYDLIITAGFTWADSLARVAQDNPEQKFLIVDVDWVGQPNVMQATFAEHEGSFLVGAAAALQSIEDGIVNPRFGFIGGIPGSLITRFHVGFVQGVLSVLPNAEIVDFYVNDWGNPALARTQAINWYGSNVYAIFSAAGMSGNGTIAEARAQRQAGRNVWAIGVDSDQIQEGRLNPVDPNSESAVLTSMVKRVEAAVVYALNSVQNDDFTGRTINFGLDMDGVGFSTTNPLMSESVIERVNQLRDQIVAGEIVVHPTLAQAMTIPGFPTNLLAVDG
jgi:basic membrane protein A